MKKLNLLKPKCNRVCLDNEARELVDYIQIPEDLGYNALKEDVDNGAKQYADLLAEDDNQRLVVIQCNTKEEGLMAVTYLAGIYNETHQEEDDDDYDDEDDYDEEDYDLYDAYEEYLEGSMEEWIESRYRMPVINYTQISECTDYSTFYRGPFSFEGLQGRGGRKPYWCKLRKHSICIMKNTESPYYEYSLSESIKSTVSRFKSNPRIYLVIVKEGAEYGMVNPNMEKEMCELMLDYTISPKVIQCDDSDMAKYYLTLFDNWTKRYDVKLKKNFPKESIVSRIKKINVMDKSELIEKIIKYVIAKNPGAAEFGKKQFDVLDVFKAIGLEKLHLDNLEKTRLLDDRLVGMKEVKKNLKGIVEIMKYNRRRSEYGLDSGGFHNVHLFIGAPGTAKTTAAQLLGNIMCEENLLPGNRFIAINGAELKGMYVGHTAPKVKKLFQEYDAILIDEAYSLCSGADRGMDSFGEEAIAQLILEIEAHGNDKLVMFSGYGGENMSGVDNKMKQFLDANPGIRSRINSTVYFKSYNADEMVDIFMSIAKGRKYTVDKAATEVVRKHFEKRCKAKDFGNGREARRLVECSMLQAAMRLKDVSCEDISKSKLSKLTLEDVTNACNSLDNGYLSQSGNTAVGFGFV